MAVPLLVSGIAFSGVFEIAAAQEADRAGIRVRVARFWRGEGRTLLEGVIGMPVATSTRTVDLTVQDSTGKVLHSETFTDSASAQSAALAALNAQTTSMLELLLGPGLYDVSVRSAEAGRVDSARVAVRAFDSAPVLSDVVVSAHMRVLAAGEQPNAAEMQRGRYAIERGTRVTVLPMEPRLWYYLELYRQGADSVAQLEFRVLPAGRDTALVRVTRNVAVGARGTVDAAALGVQGLPPGDYKLSVLARSGNREDRRESSFTMGSFETAPPVAAAAPGGSASESALFDRYFALAVRSDAAVGELVEALTVSAPGERVEEETRGLPVDAQRRFLARYWSRVPDPVPATPQHELVEEYTRRLSHVSLNYSEGVRGRPGAKTDRGRIYLKFGPPDERQLIPIPNSANAVEIWKYTGRRALKYVFLDETGFQHYNLIFTTDPQERTLHDWRERVRNAEVIGEIIRF
ncbi:MAG: GWxTD domain-containing protein [Gemmatimonadota bacterium]